MTAGRHRAQRGACHMLLIEAPEALAERLLGFIVGTGQ
jgi:hypothetical protein